MWKKTVGLVAAGLLTATGGAGASYAAMNDQVSLSVDGVVSSEGTLAPTVGAYLEQSGIALGERDVVEPAADAPIDGETTIAIRYARPLDLTVDGEQSQVWSNALTVSEALDELGYDETASVSPLRDTEIPREGLALEIGTEKSVEVVVRGKSKTVHTNGHDVQAALEAAEVEADDDDKVDPGVDEALTDGMKITYTQVEKKTEKQKKDVDFKTEEVESSTLDKGKTEVLTEGKKGQRELTFEVVYEDGKEVKRSEKDSKVLTEPVNKRVAVGTREQQEEEESTSSNSGGSGSGSSGSGSGGSSSESDSDDSSGSGSSNQTDSGPGDDAVWERLAQCESGGNWSINTGNGFYGGLQFTEQTWKSMGGSGLPHENSKAEQIRLGKKLQAQAGWGQWPACTSKLGLR